MVKQYYSLAKVQAIACNEIDSDLITLFIGEFHCRKNVSAITLAKFINRIFLEELICLFYQQEISRNLSKICNSAYKYCAIRHTVNKM